MEKKKKKIEEQDSGSKYLIPGSILILVVFALVIVLLSKTYALDGFGEVNITCNKAMVTSNDTFSCTVTGTVAANKEVSSLQAQVSLSSNLEFVSFTKDSSWEGSGEEGLIQLYTDVNKTGTFNIGTLNLRVKSNPIFNNNESVGLTSIIFYEGSDNNYQGQNITAKSIDINTPSFTSTDYDLTKDYIIIDTKNIATIISKINTTACNVTVSVDGNQNTTGTIKAGSKLTIGYNGTTLKQYDLIYLESSKYNVTSSTQYIMTNESNISTIANDFSAINATVSVKNGKLTITYNNEDIKQYDIIQLSSSTLLLSLTDSYIVVNNESEVISNITKSNNVNLSINNHYLDITYNNQVIKSLKIYSISSSKYEINIEEGYIYTKMPESDITSNIASNGNVVTSGNQVLLKSDSNTTLCTFNVIDISSTDYLVNYQNKYIFTKTDTAAGTIQGKVTIKNATSTVSNNTLTIKYNETNIDQFSLYNISSNTYQISNDKIFIGSEVTYQQFTSNLSINGLTYKIFDTNNQEISSGNVSANYTLKLYAGSTEVASYTTSIEYLTVSDDLNIAPNTNSNIVYKIPLNTTYSTILPGFQTNGTITVKDVNNQTVATSEKIKTGDIITITLGSGDVTFKASVLGDTTGDGDIQINDVGRLYQYFKNKTTMDEEYVLAGDVTKDGQIKINDVGRLYDRLRGRVTID